MSRENSEECLSCKITTISALAAIGGYLIHQGIKKNIRTYLFLGAGTIGLGMIELFKDSEEREKKDHVKRND